MSAVYHPPVMHLYFDDLISDTTDLTNEELGAYMRLLHRQWVDGDIPADSGKVGAIVGSSRTKAKTLLASLNGRFISHPDHSGRLFNTRMEKVREQQWRFANSQSDRSKSGWEKRKRKTTHGEELPGLSPGITHDDPQGDARRMPGRSPDDALLSPIADSLRSSALSFKNWPRETTELRSLAFVFVQAFANCFDPGKAEKHVDRYTPMLKRCANRGASIEECWSACIEARKANGDKPLFGATINSALDFLVNKPRRPERQEPVYQELT